MHQKSIITKLFHHKLLHAWRLASQILVISTICEGKSPRNESPCEISMIWRKMNANLCLPHLGTHWGMNAKLMNSNLAWETDYHLYFYLNLALDWKTLFLNFLYAAEQHRKHFIKSHNLKIYFFVKTGPKQDLNLQLGKILQLFLFIPVHPSTKIYTKYSICSAVQPWFQWWGCNLSWEHPASRRGWFHGHYSFPGHLSPTPATPPYPRRIPHSIISKKILINNF